MSVYSGMEEQPSRTNTSLPLYIKGGHARLVKCSLDCHLAMTAEDAHFDGSKAID